MPRDSVREGSQVYAQGHSSEKINGVVVLPERMSGFVNCSANYGCDAEPETGRRAPQPVSPPAVTPPVPGRGRGFRACGTCCGRPRRRLRGV